MRAGQRTCPPEFKERRQKTQCAPLPSVRTADYAAANPPYALGMPPPAAHGRAADHQHPQSVIAALAPLVEAREPLLGPGH